MNIDGTAGNDTLIGTTAADLITGLEGNDLLRGLENLDTLVGGVGNDTLDGGPSFDLADYQSSPDSVVVNLSTGLALDGFGGTDALTSIELVQGSSHDDVLIGGNPSSAGFEQFEGLAGSDILDGGDGFDVIAYRLSPTGVVVDLGEGSAIDGFGGLDTFTNMEEVRGSDFNDFLVGGSTNPDQFESFEGMAGNDTIDGRDGLDRASFRDSTAAVFATLLQGFANDGLAGLDSLVSIELLQGSSFNDTLIGGNPASDRFESFEGRAGDDSIDGGSGRDRVEYRSSPSNIQVDLTAGTANDGFGTVDHLQNVEDVLGSSFADLIIGNAAANLLQAGNGDDTLGGGAGNDTIDGGDGSDAALFSGVRSDYQLLQLRDILLVQHLVAGGDGIDELQGVETLVFADQIVAVAELSTAPTIDGLARFGTAADNLLAGTGLNDSLFGALGNDTVLGLAGSDIIDGGPGNDMVLGSIGDDSVVGDEGADTLAGSSGRDSLDGGGDGDLLIAGTGGDALAGGGGADTLFGGTGDDYLLGEDGDDLLSGDAGADRLDGGAGDDRVMIDAQDVFASGGDGDHDVLVLGAMGAGLIHLDLSNPADQNAGTTGPILQGFEIVDGSGASAGLIVQGGQLPTVGTTVYGSGFADTIAGAAGNDLLSGGPGPDSLDGANGSDTLVADGGNDTLSGGDDPDRFFCPNGFGPAAVRIGDFNTDDDQLWLSAGSGLTSAAALAATVQNGPDCVLAVPGGPTITLVGVTLAELTPAHFAIM